MYQVFQKDINYIKFSTEMYLVFSKVAVLLLLAGTFGGFYYFTENPGLKLAYGSQVLFAKAAVAADFGHGRFPFASMSPFKIIWTTPQAVLESQIAQYGSNGMLELLIYFSISFIAVMVIMGIVVAIYTARDKAARGEQILRGARSTTPFKYRLQQLWDFEKTHFRIGRCRMPWRVETQSIFVAGSAGSGKTENAACPIIDKAIAAAETGAKVFVYDFKGDLMPRWYDQDKHFLFNVLDERALYSKIGAWNLFLEIDHALPMADIEAISHSLLPPSKGGQQGNEKFFLDASRAVFTSLLEYLYFVTGEKNMRALAELLAAPEAKRIEVIKQTISGPNALNMLGSGKQSEAVWGTFYQHVAAFKYFLNSKTNPREFSIGEFLASDQGGVIWLTNYVKIRDTLAPVLTLFLDLAIRKSLSLSEDKNRRIYLIVDEAATLKPLSSIVELVQQGRSKGCCLALFTQSIGSLISLYSRETVEAILNSCASHIYFRVSDPGTAEYLEKTIGKSEVKTVSNSISYGEGKLRDGGTISERTETKSLVMASMLQNLHNYTAWLRFGDSPWINTDCPRGVLPPLTGKFFEPRQDLSFREILAEQAAFKAAADEGLKAKGDAKAREGLETETPEMGTSGFEAATTDKQTEQQREILTEEAVLASLPGGFELDV